MFVEVHVIQNYALSNLNRDDTGAPKTCEFGGVRRARISSQCLKRAVRTYFREESLVPSKQLGQRTRLLKEALVERLLARNVPQEEAGQLAAAAIQHLGLKLDKEKTQYLLFLGEQEMDRLATLAVEHRKALLSDQKQDKALQAQLLAALDGGGAVDVALFGRMIADKPEKNIDAAVQMAHAISTHAVATEFDFYSAVDDLQREESDEGAGAGMLGTILYNSACYYRYANVDMSQLVTNLGGDVDKARSGLRAFLEGMVHAVPSGKQTATAAQNPPALVMVTVRRKGLWSLANAFVKPIRPTANDDLTLLSAQALLTYFAQLGDMYGTESLTYVGLSTYLPLEDIPAPVAQEKSVTKLIEATMTAVASAMA
ncbi:MAG: type I-E CRISPR-associated protein Cas7/Cse4/CasC [Firmicutes bacterium ZCTH02-B6]|nr:MAG: type I-E CRISPR-associated protein Cas7/Cse4/CasC [Firmicutes bacterium ZCTH02-B6]